MAAVSAKAFLGTALTTQGSFTNHPQSIRAQNLIEQRLTGPAKDTELLIVHSPALTVSDPRFAAFVTGLRSSVLALGPGVVVSAPDYLPPGGRGLGARDQHATLIPVTIARNFDNATAHIARLDQIARAHQRPPFQVLVANSCPTSPYTLLTPYCAGMSARSEVHEMRPVRSNSASATAGSPPTWR